MLYWAKTRSGREGLQIHRLVHHSLDVAAVAAELFRVRSSWADRLVTALG